MSASSLREQILEAIQATLVVGGGPAGLQVQRLATFPADPTALPLIKFYWMSDAAEWLRPTGGGPLIQQRMQVQFEVYGAGVTADGTASDAQIDAVLVWLDQRMFADVRFGGLAAYVSRVKADAVAVAEDRSYVRVDAVYEVLYVTKPGDLTSRGL